MKHFAKTTQAVKWREALATAVTVVGVAALLVPGKAAQAQGTPAFRFSQDAYEQLEFDPEAGFATITIVPTAPITSIQTVNFSTTAGGTATAGDDYTPVNITRQIPPNPTAAQLTFFVEITPDFLLEDDETVNLTLKNGSGTVIDTAELTILDNRAVASPDRIVWSFNEDRIRINWTSPDPEVSGFQVFRSVGGSEFALFRTVGPGVNQITQDDPREDTDYAFKVRSFRDVEVPGEPDPLRVFSGFSPVARFRTDGDNGPGRQFRLQVSPKRLNFGRVRPGRSKALTVRLTNVGNVPLTLSVRTPNLPFVLVGASGDFVLGARKSRVFRIVFRPTARGNSVSSIVFSSSNSQAQAGVGLAGQAR